MSHESFGLLLVVLRLTLVICLYAFFAWAFITLWRSLRAGAPKQKAAGYPAITLLFTQPPLPPEVRFRQQNIVLGRAPDCECVIDNGTISTHHAQLSYSQNQWWLEDLGSRNGTFLNEQPLSAPAVLTNNDIIRCGEVSFHIFIED